ncbi:S8 family peptidase [Natronogracilivirgula saccharolytica]|uniref:S8 family peptidase n=2 Tax=Natronogracilivirga saccharolytica TaxID=2812953 RepID=A0A8J7RW10_9BACT|nr:S8 family peptidase [Natronogracilivirga saccharolytica]
MVGIPELTEGKIPDSEYLPGQLMVRVEPQTDFNKAATSKEYASAERLFPSSLQNMLDDYDLISARPVFGSAALYELHKEHISNGKISQKSLEMAHALQHTYSIRFGSGDDPKTLSSKLENEPGVIYAEPHYVHKTAEFVTHQTYLPNDPYIGSEGHNYFDYLNLNRAWALQTGSPDVVIAIIDSGVYYDHPDLKDNLWRNPEPGRANDFFDEFEISNDTIGWNFWESGDIFSDEAPVQNADPVGNYSTHGTRVAGIAAAVTDNGIGMAGVGFQTRFMPVKAGGTKNYPNTIAFAYHAIIYAAINGADVINCSFYGSDRSRFGEDAIAFAMESGSVVVAAIGNKGVETNDSYPALFDDVLSVGAVTDQFDDKLAHFSNFSRKLDVVATGKNILGTTFEYDEELQNWTPGFTTSNGTSFSTPMVSGLAALIKAEHPDWPPQQIANQIRGSARSIYHANPNPEFLGKLGNGVIDAYDALTKDVPVISFTDYHFTKDGEQKINTGQTGTLVVEGIHLGNDSPELHFRLESLQTGALVLNEVATKNNLGPGERFSIEFTISIEDDYQLDIVPQFRLTLSTDDLDHDRYEIEHFIEYEELLYGVLENNKLTVSIPPDGSIGFMNAKGRYVGLGLIPDIYENVLSEAGLMIGGFRDGEKVVINQVRDSTGISRHFHPVKNTYTDLHSDLRNAYKATASFASYGHPKANDISIELEAITSHTSTIDQTLLLIYHVRNNSDQLYSDLHFGVYNHWKTGNSTGHRTDFDSENHVLYTSPENGRPYVGVSVAGDLASALAIDNQSGMTLSRAEDRSDSLRFGTKWDPYDEQYDGFTDPEKFLALTAGTDRTGISAEDISTVISTGPYTLYPQSVVTVGFIYGWGNTSGELLKQISNVKEMDLWEMKDDPGKYSRTGKVADEITLHPPFPNPFDEKTTIRFDLTESGHVDLRVYNMMGERVTTLVDGTREEGPNFVNFEASSIASGLYIVVLRADGRTQSQLVTLIK